MLNKDGVPTMADLAAVMPSAARLSQGPVSIIECFQKIPCNPCVEACVRGAISMAGDINDTPVLDENKCNGCGICVSRCPGLAIFVVDASAADYAIVQLPYEYVPVPEKGQMVCGLSRAGEKLGVFEVTRVVSGGQKNMTRVVSLKVPKDLAMEVRGISVGGIEDGE